MISCDDLKKKIDAETDPAKKAVLQALYYEFCSVHTDDGGGPGGSGGPHDGGPHG